MSSIKHLVTSGCSFSLTNTIRTPEEGNGWPYWLAKALDAELHNTAMGSQGNDLIARKAIHKVTELIDSGVDAEDIMVGIVWSGAGRKDFYSSSVPADFPVNESGWLKNPEQFVESDQPNGGWVIMSPGWLHHYSKIWYSEFDDTVGAHINTYERIHWTQNYLQNVGVKYFMTTFMSNVVNYMNSVDPKDQEDYYQNCRHDLNIAWMHNSIDWNCFLPVASYSSWCAENFEDFEDFHDHPHNHHAEAFVDKVVVPFLQEHKYL